MAKKFVSKNEKKEARGKTLNFEKESFEVRSGLEVSRKAEWDKWIQFLAGRPCRGKELQELLEAGDFIATTRLTPFRTTPTMNMVTTTTTMLRHLASARRLLRYLASSRRLYHHQHRKISMMRFRCGLP